MSRDPGAHAAHEAFMRLAMREADNARGGTGDNPWVGCVIVGASGTILGCGHTHGPGEDHAEIDAGLYSKYSDQNTVPPAPNVQPVPPHSNPAQASPNASSRAAPRRAARSHFPCSAVHGHCHG